MANTQNKEVTSLPPVFRVVTNGDRYRIQTKDKPNDEWRYVQDLWVCEMGGGYYTVEYRSLRRAKRRMNKEIMDALRYWTSKNEQWVPVAV